MFNSDLKKRAIEELEIAGRTYNYQYDGMIKHIENLHSKRIFSRDLLIKVESYINSIANKPKEYEKRISKIHVRRMNFDDEVEKFKKEASDSDALGGVAGAGALAGAGVAAMGPTAAMAIATTFGTASTGAAISTLSGAAATKAALAWLGGGALSAGGAGMAGGQILLKLMGPVGWGLSAVALIGGGIWANKKNRDIAKKAEFQTNNIKRETKKVQQIDAKVDKMYSRITEELNKGLSDTLEYMENTGVFDYCDMTDDHKAKLIVIMNSSEALSVLIGEKIE